MKTKASEVKVRNYVIAPSTNVTIELTLGARFVFWKTLVQSPRKKITPKYKSAPNVKRPQSIRYVEHEGAIVSAHVLEHMELSVGENWVRAVRVEYVGTAPSFRMNGLCRLLMDDSMALLKTGGTQLAVVFGEPLFRRLGFEYCIPTYMQTMPNYSPPGSAIIPTRALAELKSSQWFRPMSPEDLPRIAGVHSRDNPAGNFSRRRAQYYWRHLVKTHGIDTYHVVGHRSEVTGYVRIESGRGSVQAKEVVAVVNQRNGRLLEPKAVA